MKILSRILFLLLLGCGIVFVLYTVSFKMNDTSNGFLRTKINQRVTRIAKLEMPTEDISRIIYFNDSMVLLSGKSAGAFIIIDLKSTVHKKIAFDIQKVVEPPHQFKYLFRNELVYIMAVNIPGVIICNMHDYSIRLIRFQDRFSECTLIKDSVFAIRSKFHEKGLTGLQFAKLTIGQTTLKTNSELLKNYDAGFSTSGIMHYDASSGSIVYIQFFNNQVLCLDSNMKLRYTFHTIDTFTTPKAEVVGSTKRGYTFSKPPITINKRNTVWDGLLFNISAIKADNESLQEFNENLVIDVYRLRDGLYNGSYYIPNTASQRINDLKVHNSRLAVLTQDTLTIYQL